jgi:G3E family GTPase
MAETPVTLITGFLGAGKTTLLSRLLRDPWLGETAVLINEFGAVGLDHHLLERLDETTVLLKSGCLCCTIRGDLSQAIRDLQARRDRGAVPHFRRLMIESTGLADPFPILSTLHGDPVLRHHFRPGTVITVVDAVLGRDQLARQPESVKQVAVADRLVVTKTDLAPDTDALVAALRRINPSAPLLRPAEDAVSAETLLTPDYFDLPARSDAARHWFDTESTAHHHHHDPNRHGAAIRAFALSIDQPLDWTRFGIWLSMLLHRHGADILRVKGILNVTGSPTPVALHAVQHLVHPPLHLGAWPDDSRESRLVFILNNLDPTQVERSLRAFQGRRPPPLPFGTPLGPVGPRPL